MRGIKGLVLIATLICAGSLSAQQTTLDQARAAADTRNYVQATQLYRQVLASEPDNTQALGGLSDSLESSGGWHEALPLLEHLLTLEPNNAVRLAQLGRMRSWQKGQRQAALDLSKRACDLNKTHLDYCIQYADVLSWNNQGREESVRVLRAIVATNPGYIPAVAKLAEVLSWNRETRPEALQLFENAVNRDPDNSNLLASYGEVLTYQGGSRSTAMSCFNHAIKLDPSNLRAMNGKAQLLAWEGRSDEALALYEKALVADPANVFALRGKAEILNWRGDYQEAGDLLAHARELAPDDPRVVAEIARTEIGRTHFGEARQTLSLLPFDPEFRDIRGEVARALGTYVEFGFTSRFNQQNLNYQQPQVAVSTPLGLSNRLTFSFRPTLYQPRTPDFNGNTYGVQLDSRISENAGLTTHFSVDTYPGFSTGFNGGAQFRVKVRPSLEVQAGFERAPVDDSVESLRGFYLGGVEQGQVRANLGNLGFSYNNSPHHFDIWATYGDGVFTGNNLDSNRRWGFDGQFGKALRGGAPYIRLAYGVSYAQFQYDADIPSVPNRYGGYFSPQQFLLNYGALTVNHKFGTRVELQATGTLGVQNVAATFSNFGNAQFASSFRSRVLWRITDKNELRFGYDFLNVYNAVDRSLPSISWRHYF
jgi:tetratricopeptide (TPR) repeat protein